MSKSGSVSQTMLPRSSSSNTVTARAPSRRFGAPQDVPRRTARLQPRDTDAPIGSLESFRTVRDRPVWAFMPDEAAPFSRKRIALTASVSTPSCSAIVAAFHARSSFSSRCPNPSSRRATSSGHATPHWGTRRRPQYLAGNIHPTPAGRTAEAVRLRNSQTVTSHTYG